MSYKTAVHLIGEQPIPVYIGLRQFPAENHLFLVTDLTKSIGERFVREFSEQHGRITLIKCSPYDIREIYEDLRRNLSGQIPADVVFNLTGGTKTMFVAAFLVSREMGF